MRILKNGIFLIGLLVFAGLSSYGQKVYFIYLQTENQQPFFARVNEKTLNSSAAGYLILPNLRDSSYDIHIGFPGNQWPEQQFQVNMNKRDHGFLIKNFSDQGWGLFNLQTLAVTMPSKGKTDIVIKKEKRETSDFTDLLAKAADDSTLKEKPVIVKTIEEKPVITSSSDKPNKKDSIVVENPEQVSEKQAGELTKEKEVSEVKDSVKITEAKEILPANTDSVTLKDQPEVIEEKKAESEYKKSKVKLVSESSTTQGFSLTFFDIYPDGKTDTIRIQIPPQTGKAIKSDDKPDEQETFNLIPADSVSKKVQGGSQSEETKITRKNVCTNTATEDDFFRLRKNMASETGVENMLNEARKAFRNKCYTTFQIRNLSTLFLTDESKYRFFDTAYSFSADEEKYADLISELKDEYYITRFRAMLR